MWNSVSQSSSSLNNDIRTRASLGFQVKLQSHHKTGWMLPVGVGTRFKYLIALKIGSFGDIRPPFGGSPFQNPIPGRYRSVTVRVSYKGNVALLAVADASPALEGLPRGVPAEVAVADHLPDEPQQGRREAGIRVDADWRERGDIDMAHLVRMDAQDQDLGQACVQRQTCGTSVDQRNKKSGEWMSKHTFQMEFVLLTVQLSHSILVVSRRAILQILGVQ
jgi:hypothetical protein